MKRLLTIASLFSLLLLGACGSGQGGNVTIQLPQNLLSNFPNIVRVVLRISAEDIDTIQVELDAPFTGEPSFDVEVETGTDRLMEVWGVYDSAFPSSQGFYGSALADVDEDGTSVTVNLQFVNRVLDDPTDGLDANRVDDPDIQEVVFSRGLLASTCSDTESIIIEVSIDPSFTFPFGHFINVLIDFDTDSDSSTGLTPSSSTAIGAAIAAATPPSPLTSDFAGTERHIAVNIGDSGTALITLTGTGGAAVISGTVDTVFQAVYSLLNRTLSICINSDFYAANMNDPDMTGNFNVLVMRNDGFDNFPNDLMMSSGSGRYDIALPPDGFDTSSL